MARRPRLRVMSWSNLGGPGFLKRVETVKAGKDLKPPSPLEEFAIRFANSPTHEGVRELLGAFGEQAGVRSHRPA